MVEEVLSKTMFCLTQSQVQFVLQKQDSIGSFICGGRKELEVIKEISIPEPCW